MAAIFISYRREDSGGYAGRLAQDLRGWFGNDQVFLDINMQAGTTFARQLEFELSKCSVVIALIGKQWLTVRDPQGRRRIDQAYDFLHLELASALRRRVRIIPVLVQAARLPSLEELPETLRGILQYQATELLDTHWDLSVRELAWTLAQSGAGLRTQGRRWLQRGASLSLAIALGAGAWAAVGSSERARPEPSRLSAVQAHAVLRSQAQLPEAATGSQAPHLPQAAATAANPPAASVADARSPARTREPRRPKREAALQRAALPPAVSSETPSQVGAPTPSEPLASKPRRAKVEPVTLPIYAAGTRRQVGALLEALASDAAGCFRAGVPSGAAVGVEGPWGVPGRYHQCFRLAVDSAGSISSIAPCSVDSPGDPCVTQVLRRLDLAALRPEQAGEIRVSVLFPVQGFSFVY